EAIRKQWKDRALLLNTDPSTKDPNAAAPDEARYDSDRNRKVEKETRARITDVLPKPGAPGAAGSPAKPKAAPQPQTKPIPLANLSNLHMPGPNQLREKQSPQDDSSSADQGQGAQGGSAQSLLDPSLAQGDQNVLNTQESKYYSFYSRIYESLAPLWQSRVRTAAINARLSPGEYMTRAEVILDAEGNYQETRIVQSSGVRGIDDAIDQAWKRIPRFPNPPKDLIGPDGLIHMGWTFNLSLDSSAGLQYLPPQRNY
ncbi:MAG: hypothetical protein EOP84_31405, partial [Verrucomicrobiaceae bacterium]